MVLRGTSRAVGIFLRLVTCTCLKANEEEPMKRKRQIGVERLVQTGLSEVRSGKDQEHRWNLVKSKNTFLLGQLDSRKGCTNEF